MTMFQKRHYIAIAAVLKEAREDCGREEQREVVDRVAGRMVASLARDNYNFDSMRFLSACGIPD